MFVAFNTLLASKQWHEKDCRFCATACLQAVIATKKIVDFVPLLACKQ